MIIVLINKSRSKEGDTHLIRILSVSETTNDLQLDWTDLRGLLCIGLKRIFEYSFVLMTKHLIKFRTQNTVEIVFVNVTII